MNGLVWKEPTHGYLKSKAWSNLLYRWHLWGWTNPHVYVSKFQILQVPAYCSPGLGPIKDLGIGGSAGSVGTLKTGWFDTHNDQPFVGCPSHTPLSIPQNLGFLAVEAMACLVTPAGWICHCSMFNLSIATKFPHSWSVSVYDIFPSSYFLDTTRLLFFWKTHVLCRWSSPQPQCVLQTMNVAILKIGWIDTQMIWMMETNANIILIAGWVGT
jgi:hypothetical protein